MIKLLKNRSKRNRKESSTRDTVSIDISRVVPGFTPTDYSADAPVSEPAVEPEAPAAMAAQTDAPQDADGSLEQKYEAWLERDLSRLTQSWAALGEDMTDLARYKQVRLATHDLKGMAGSYGYPVIARLAQSLDTLLKNALWDQSKPLIDLHIQACQAAAAGDPATEGEIDAASKAVCDALDAHVKNLGIDAKLAS